MPWPPKMPIVEVEWVDSCSLGRWRDAEDYRRDAQPDACRTAGYLLVADAERVVIVQNQGATGNVAESIAIPRAAIQRIRRLAKAR